MNFLSCLVVVLVAFSTVEGSIRKMPHLQQTVTTKSPKWDMCPFCVNFMDNSINDLLNIILNAGVIGSCADLCSFLPNQLEQVACDLICDYVGIEAFIDFITYEDPDPIYLCQLFDICPHVDGGKVNITATSITPPSGATGTTFTIEMDYKVIAQTSSGLVAINILPPDGFPLGDGEFEEGQAPGSYSAKWTVDTTPSEQEDFGPGIYQVQLAVCAGDCTTSHPWGGVYAQVNTQFKITGN